MKIIIQKSLLAFVLLCSTTVMAQTKSLPGYYISPQGDTVKGLFPGYAQWDRNPAKVQFETARTEKAILLTPQTCRKFVVEGYEEYLSYDGFRLLNPVSDAEAIESQTPGLAADTVENLKAFLRLVTALPGGALYAFKDGKRTNFFLQTGGGLPVELRYKKYVEKQTIIDLAEFRQQINRAFYQQVVNQNCYKKLQRLTYTEEGLAEFFEVLFPDLKAKQRGKNPAAGWFASAGVSRNEVKVETDDNSGYVAGKYNSQISPLLSLGYDLPTSRNFGRYFFFPQVRFFRYQNTGEYLQGSFIRNTTYEADLVGILEAGGGINVVNQDNVRVFIGAGIGALLQVNGRQTRSAYWPTDHSLYLSSTSTLSKLTYAVDVFAGATFSNRLMVSATYMLPAPIASFVFYTPTLSGLQVCLGYKLH